MAAPQATWGQLYEVPESTTADDLLRMPDDGCTNELYDGTLLRHFHSAGQGGVFHRAGGELGIYTRETGFAHPIVQNTLFDLTPPSATRKTVLAPDLAILPPGAAQPWDTVTGDVPLLAIEVVSESQTLTELALKAQFYRTDGVAEVWVVDHKTRGIDVWTAQGRTMLHDTQTLTSPLLPGFSVAVRALLDG